MSDQCRYCRYVDDLHSCLEADCGKHDDFIVRTLKTHCDELAEALFDLLKNSEPHDSDAAFCFRNKVKAALERYEKEKGL